MVLRLLVFGFAVIAFFATGGLSKLKPAFETAKIDLQLAKNKIPDIGKKIKDG